MIDERFQNDSPSLDKEGVREWLNTNWLESSSTPPTLPLI